MGVVIYDALVLAKVSGFLRPGGRVLTLGVPTFAVDPAQLLSELKDRQDFIGVNPDLLEGYTDYKDFFRRLGFSEADSLDVSRHEGADFVDDLNDPGVATRLSKRYDLIYDPGTTEHIFDAPTALRTIASLLNIGGVVVHANPANGFVDHGFWQLSPDLFRTFYRAAGFSQLTSALYVLGANPSAMDARENIYRVKGRQFIVENIPAALAVFAAQKVREVHPINVRLQDYYGGADNEGGDASEAFFIQFAAAEPARPTVMSKMRQTKLWRALRKLRDLILNRAAGRNPSKKAA